jgi:hypothetical protein
MSNAVKKYTLWDLPPSSQELRGRLSGVFTMLSLLISHVTDAVQSLTGKVARERERLKRSGA